MNDLTHNREYRRLAWAAAVLLLLFGLATLGPHGLAAVSLNPDGSSLSFVSSVSSVFCVISVLLSAAAPVVASRNPWIGFLLAVVVPVWLVWIYHVWAFTSLAALLAVTVVVMGRSVVVALPMAVVAMAFPLSLLGEVTMTMPDQAQIYLGYGGKTAASIVTTEAAYGIGILLVLAAGGMFRRYVAERGAVVRDVAVLSERARLARDLHDVIAHHVSLIAVRAETAPYTVPDLGHGGRTAMSDIATEARLAMTELRGVLGVLRRSDGTVALTPQPTGKDVASLVADAGRTGEVAYEGDTHIVALTAPVGYAVYRLVQEALTNARRHAPGASVNITATRTDDVVTVSVSNEVPPGTVLRPGAGLAGMRERVEAVGGHFNADVVGSNVVIEAAFPGEAKV